MFHQFNHIWSEPRYWIDEKEGRKRLLGSNVADTGQKLIYQNRLLGYREIASNTNERTIIATVIPPHVFANHKVILWNPNIKGYTQQRMLFVSGLLNSFVVDYLVRQRVTANVNFFYVYQLPIPRLTAQDPAFSPIVTRAAKLICTTPEFNDLAAEVGLGSFENGATDPAERAKLRAELDGMVAHLYGLTEDEFAYILTTFPLVEQSVKDAALEAYRTLAPQPGDAEIVRLIASGESERLEFKSTARWNIRANMADKKMEEVVAKTVAAFLNADGGTLLIGVANDGEVLGLESDFATLGKKPNRDGFELFLGDLLFRGKLWLSGLIGVTFHEVAGKTVCKVVAKPSPQPVWTDIGGAERLFVRAGDSTRELSASEAYAYARRRWG